jgi:hypothetical protein
MRMDITLPQLEKQLEGLKEGSLHQISRRDYERLFGKNDAALGRLRSFSKGQECVASFTDNHILFRKKLQAASAQRG